MRASKKRKTEVMLKKAGYLSLIKIKTRSLKSAHNINVERQLKREIEDLFKAIEVCNRWSKMYR